MKKKVTKAAPKYSVKQVRGKLAKAADKVLFQKKSK